MSAMTHEEIKIGPIAVRFLLEGSATDGGAPALFEFDVKAGSPAPPAHSHDGYEETLYGLRGTLTWTVDGERIEVGEGEVLSIPRGAVHRFENEGDVDATQLAIVTPAVLGPAYFRELAELVGAGGPPDPAAIGAVMRRHGLTPAG
jgi:quercetin dioxygenase-like cupin family protein